MENKEYFIPEISDFYFGYEFEYQAPDKKWHKCTYHMNNTDKLNFIYIGVSNLQSLIDKEEIRVPYLTKEQLETEGWKYDEKYNDEKHFYKDETYLKLYIGYQHEEIIFHNISIFNANGVLFRGECKCINDFRKICKLLEI
jgi:hypothetical protein